MRPVLTEPVKVMALTSGELMIASPTTEPLPMTRLSTPLGSPARARMSTIAQARAGHQIGRLEHDRIAVAERRRDLPGRNGDREIPRRDDADDADRLARHGHFEARPHARHDLAGEPQRLAGEEIEDLPGAHRLADALGQRLALLAGEQAAELLAPLENLVAGRLEDVVALLDARARPRRERRLGGGDGALGVVGAAARVVADDLVGVGRVDVGDGLARPPSPRRCSCGADRP